MKENDINYNKVMVTLQVEVTDEAAFVVAANAVTGKVQTRLQDIMYTLSLKLLDGIPGHELASVSTAFTEQWVNDRELISTLYKIIEQQEELCCHASAGTEHGLKCPPTHNCQLCNDVHLG